ncbi:MAG: Clp protease N-terminal domain-containing protein, partial [Halioglobus sp.]|nr:Clp protease N-terminal domain-containing protein [Halioglobus sp.]
MRMDKLTNQLQTALADAQSLALGRDHNFIEPIHLLSALLEQSGGACKPLLQRAGADVTGLVTATKAAIDALPTVSGTGGEIHLSQ